MHDGVPLGLNGWIGRGSGNVDKVGGDPFSALPVELLFVYAKSSLF